MTLRKRKGQHYGDGPDDVIEFLRDYSDNNYPAEHFKTAVCKKCKGKVFGVELDDAAGVCVRTCIKCKKPHPIGDSADFMDEAEPDDCQCPCKNETFEITVGVALYEDSKDVRWIYIGLRCAKCGLVGSYGDWKNEFDDYKQLFARV